MRDNGHAATDHWSAGTLRAGLTVDLDSHAQRLVHRVIHAVYALRIDADASIQSTAGALEVELLPNNAVVPTGKLWAQREGQQAM